MLAIDAEAETISTFPCGVDGPSKWDGIAAVGPKLFEDDAVVQPERLWAFDAALRLLHGAGHNATVSPPPSVVHLSSYHPIGHDMVPCGLQPRHRANKQYMAGVANAVTLVGARQLLRVPIEATGSDAAFSLYAQCAATPNSAN